MSPDVRSVLPGVEPFAELEGVWLGMTAGELAAVRTTVFTIPYFGYRDSAGVYGVVYQFAGSGPEASGPPDDDQLVRVGAERHHGSDAEGDSVYRARAREISAILGPPDACLTPHTGSSTRAIARWEVGALSVYIEWVHAGGPPGSGRARAQPAATRTVIARDQGGSFPGSPALSRAARTERADLAGGCEAKASGAEPRD